MTNQKEPFLSNSRLFVLGLTVGTAGLVLVSFALFAILPIGIKSNLLAALEAGLVVHRPPPPRDSPVTIRGGSIMGEARGDTNGWEQIELGLAYKLNVSKADYRGKLGFEDDLNHFRPFKQNKRWEVDISDRFSTGSPRPPNNFEGGIRICSAVKQDAHWDKDPCELTDETGQGKSKFIYVFTVNRTDAITLLSDDNDPEAKVKYKWNYTSSQGGSSSFVSRMKIRTSDENQQQNLPCTNSICAITLEK